VSERVSEIARALLHLVHCKYWSWSITCDINCKVAARREQYSALERNPQHQSSDTNLAAKRVTRRTAKRSSLAIFCCVWHNSAASHCQESKSMQDLERPRPSKSYSPLWWYFDLHRGIFTQLHHQFLSHHSGFPVRLRWTRGAFTWRYLGFPKYKLHLLIEVTVAGAESNTLRDRCQQLPKIISCVSGDAFIAVLKNCTCWWF
jgi:hypothetical protein